MRAESRLSSIEKPALADGESKAAYSWRLIRRCVRQATAVMKQADVKELEVCHGVQHSRRLRHHAPITHLLYDRIKQVKAVCCHRKRYFIFVNIPCLV